MSSDIRRNPFVFVVGCPRSGTTLLQRMLDHHPRLAVANDTHFIPRALEKTDRRLIKQILQQGDVPLDGTLVDSVRGYHRFPRLGLSPAEAQRAAEASETFGEFISALYAELARQRQKPLAGEKTPDYVRHLPLLGRLFPWSKAIHIVRDGRDVALSLFEWAGESKGPGRLALWHDEPYAVAALWWKWLVSSGRSAGAALGAGRYLEVQYERLVADSEGQLRRIMRFLEIPFRQEMLEFHTGKTARGNSAKSAWLPPTAGLRAWRREMEPRHADLFEILGGDLLASLGYECASHTISAELSRAAEKCQTWWNTSGPTCCRPAAEV